MLQDPTVRTPIKPTCRRPGCPEPAVPPHGFCIPHDLKYATWRTWRDKLEAADLDGAGIPEHHEPDPATESALAALYEHLTPGPFTGEHR